MPQPEISAKVPDWTREQKKCLGWDPSRSLINSIRVYQRRKSSRFWITRWLSKLTVLRYRFWTVVTGADIPLNCRFEGGLLLPHPNGIVIHAKTKIGPNCLIFQQVTLGTRNGAGPPSIGGHVDIGAGARILGDIVIGSHSRIGANAVVLEDVPEGGTAIGIPASVIE